MTTHLTSRPATIEDEEAVAELLLCMFQEVGRSALNPRKALYEVQDTIRFHACFVIEHNGMIVGSVGVTPLPGGLFYSDAPWLVDKWFYVMPQYRPSNLDACAFRLLLAEVQRLCDRTGIPCLLRVFNEKRIRSRNSLDEIARAYACYPAGAVVEMRPKAEMVTVQ